MLFMKLPFWYPIIWAGCTTRRSGSLSVPVVDRDVSDDPHQHGARLVGGHAGEVVFFFFGIDEFDFDQLMVFESLVDGCRHLVGQPRLADLHDGLKAVGFPG